MFWKVFLLEQKLNNDIFSERLRRKLAGKSFPQILHVTEILN